MGRSKGADEVFCTACGTRIKRAAEHCPHCGVSNDWYDPTAELEEPADAGPDQAEPGHEDAAQGETPSGKADVPPEQRSPSEVQATRDANAATGEGSTAGTETKAATTRETAKTATTATTTREIDEGRAGRWWYGVAAFAAVWAVVLGAWAAGVQHGALGTLALLAWVGLPAALARDATFVREWSEWQPSSGLWAFAVLVPVANVAVAAVYLIRRHEVLGVP